MANVKKFMNKYIKILIVLIAIVVGIGSIKYFIEHRTGYGAVSYHNENIPSGFLYESGEIPDSYLSDKNYIFYDIFYRGDCSFNDNFSCVSSGTPAELIKYFTSDPGYNIMGGWSFRYAVVCGNQYLIVDGSDAIGEKIYGPFDLNEPELDTPDISSPGVIEIPGGAWNIYTNEKYGFSFEYPSDWFLEDDSHGRPYVLLTSPERKIAAQNAEGDEIVVIDAKITTYNSYKDLPNNKDGLNFESWLKVEDDYFNGEITPITVDDLSAYLIHSTSKYRNVDYNFDFEFVMLEHNEKIYQLNFNVPSSNDYLEERDHMLQSFELIGN